MKSLILGCMAVLFTFSANAIDLTYTKLVCQQYDYKTQEILPLTVVLERTGEWADELDADGGYLGQVAKYYLQVFDGPSLWPMVKAEGKVLTEDVIFNFTSNDLKVEFGVYLDEMEESSLRVKMPADTITGTFYCR